MCQPCDIIHFNSFSPDKRCENSAEPLNFAPWSSWLLGTYCPCNTPQLFEAKMNQAGPQAIALIHLSEFARWNTEITINLAEWLNAQPSRYIVVYGGGQIEAYPDAHDTAKRDKVATATGLAPTDFQITWALMSWGNMIASDLKYIAWLGLFRNRMFTLQDILKRPSAWKPDALLELPVFSTAHPDALINEAECLSALRQWLCHGLLVEWLDRENNRTHRPATDRKAQILLCGDRLWLLHGLLGYQNNCRAKVMAILKALEDLVKRSPSGVDPFDSVNKPGWRVTIDKIEAILGGCAGGGGATSRAIDQTPPSSGGRLGGRSAQLESAPLKGAIRILMVDDYPEQIEQMRIAFTRLPEVALFVGAPHAEEALQQLRQQTFDLILMDQQWSNPDIPLTSLTDREGNLPAIGQPESDLQGLGIMRYLRQNGVTIPIIFGTAAANTEVAFQAMAAGASTYYSKANLLQRPEYVLHYLGQCVGDQAHLRRLLREYSIEADHLSIHWFSGQRAVWMRQWPVIVRQSLEYLAGQGQYHISMGELHRFNQQTLPDILRKAVEPVNADELRQFLVRQGLAEVEQPHYFEPFWLCQNSPGELLIVLDPKGQDAAQNSLATWPDLCQQWQQLAGVLPSQLLDWPLGPNDPYWGVSHLWGVQVTASDPVSAWTFDASPHGQGRSPLPALAGRLGSPGAAFWQNGRQACLAWDTLNQESLSCAPLYALNRNSAALERIPFPRRLLSNEVRDKLERPPLQQLLYLHRGFISPLLDFIQTQQALEQLPLVEIWRSGWSNAFEEATLHTVLDTLAKNPASPCAIWLATDFMQVRGGRLLKLWAREFDLVLLAPQGICILECKASTKESDLRSAHIQIKNARELIWLSRNPQKPDAGVMLRDVLINRLNQMKSNAPLPNDLLLAVPATLRKQLSTAPNQAKNLINDYYEDLASIPVNPGTETAYHFLLPDNRNKIPAVIGVGVAPQKVTLNADNDPAQPTQPFILTRSEELPNYLARWLKLPAIFNEQQYQKVYDSLCHLSHGAQRDGLRSFSGFTPLEAREKPLGNDWQVIDGHAAWGHPTYQAQTLLVRALSQTNPTQLNYYASWPTTILQTWHCELRWLDIRGLPAEHVRDLRQLAIVVHGRLINLDKSKTQAVHLRLEGMAELFRLGCEPAVAQIIGVANSLPKPMAQELAPNTPWRWAWLAGNLQRQTFNANGNDCVQLGLRRVIDALLDWLPPSGTGPEATAKALLLEAQNLAQSDPLPLDKLAVIQHNLQATAQQAKLIIH